MVRHILGDGERGSEIYMVSQHDSAASGAYAVAFDLHSNVNPMLCT